MTKELRKEIIQNIASGALSIVALLWLGKHAPKCEDYFEFDDSDETGFESAIAAITESDMMSWYKNEAIRYVKKKEGSSYYNAIINIVRSDMMSYYKLEAIKSLSKS